MESRMEKYHEIDIEEFQRSKKNTNLYKEVYGNYDAFENLPIPENTNEIDIENLKSLVESRNSRKKEILESQKLDLEDNLEITKDDKVYDINTLLEMAKEENAKIKKEVPISKKIPNYLANLESDKSTKEIILKYKGDNDDDLPIVKETKYSTSKLNVLENCNSTSNLSLDILSDLKPTGDTLVSEPIKEENKEIDNEKDFFDDKINFSKEDFDSEEDDDEFFIEENRHIFLKVLFVITFLLFVFVATFFILKEYTNIF